MGAPQIKLVIRCQTRPSHLIRTPNSRPFCWLPRQNIQSNMWSMPELFSCSSMNEVIPFDSIQLDLIEFGRTSSFFRLGQVSAKWKPIKVDRCAWATSFPWRSACRKHRRNRNSFDQSLGNPSASSLSFIYRKSIVIIFLNEMPLWSGDNTQSLISTRLSHRGISILSGIRGLSFGTRMSRQFIALLGLSKSMR
jgi:hypothetical protein